MSNKNQFRQFNDFILDIVSFTAPKKNVSRQAGYVLGKMFASSTETIN
jgi:hypothetical protein